MAKAKMTIPADKLALYDALISRFPDIQRKGVTGPYTSMNGNMYTFMRKDGTLGIRLSDQDIISFRAKYKTGPFESHGAVMRGYVLVPDELLEDLDVMTEYIQMSFEFAKTLKAKPTKKKKTK